MKIQIYRGLYMKRRIGRDIHVNLHIHLITPGTTANQALLRRKENNKLPASVWNKLKAHEKPYGFVLSPLAVVERHGTDPWSELQDW